MLVSTTIIESGLDIPQANTLIVERADRLGLAQLYQIRGRVGRSRERAYAYLLYPSAEALSARGGGAARDAVRLHGARLRASRSRCATSRSAAPATCSGDEQSGHVAAVGFELYCQMLDEAVAGAPSEPDGEDGDGAGSRCASTCRSTPTSRPTTSPTRSPRSTSTAASPRRASRPSSSALARGARGPLRPAARAGREPDAAPGGADQAGPRGRADGGAAPGPT